MALDNGYHYSQQALATLTDKTYETPPKAISGQSSRQGSSSPFSNYSPAPLLPEKDLNIQSHLGSAESGEDERYDSRDPRRLTPNLGISFVSQIHSLKKELEGKDVMVGSLEETLHESKAENERLTQDLNAQKAEVKSVKRQMQSLEHDMLQALEDIAKERDSAVDSVADTRRRLEASKKDSRTQEEEATKAQSLWERDKEEWENDKRKLESKVHVVEERLKTMVAEMMAVQSTGQNRPGISHDMDEGMRDTWFSQGNDVRSASRASIRSLEDVNENKKPADYRASRLSGLHDMGGSNISGLSLADELREGEEDLEEHDHGILSPDALSEEARMMPARYSEDQKARKVMGFHTDYCESLFGDENSGQHSMGIIEDYINIPGKRASISYTDTATQFTPPPSPTHQTKRMDSVSEKPIEQTEQSANQSRKRVAIPSIFVEQTLFNKVEESKASCMVATGCQTDKRLASPVKPVEIDNEPRIPKVSIEMTSASTQTVEETLGSSKAASTRLSSAPLEVPVIAIHPPASRPPSSHNSVVLPPRTRNAGCQVVIEMPRNLRSTSMQTEEIRIDKRPIRVPPRLHPIKLPPKETSRLAERRTHLSQAPLAQSLRRNVRSSSAQQNAAPAPEIPRRHSKSIPSQAAPDRRKASTLPKTEDFYLGSNDNGPLSAKQTAGPKRPTRSGSVYAGFETEGDGDKEKVPIDFSDDDDFVNAAPIRKTLSKVQNSWRLVPQAKESGLPKLESAAEEAEDLAPEDVPSKADPKVKGPEETTKSKAFPTNTAEALRRSSTAAKPTNIRRQDLVSNGIAEHAQRARSPSAPSAPGTEAVVVAPPFPVPTRSSSRKIPVSASEGAASPTPYSTSFFTTRRSQNGGRPPIKRKILRKTQSAAAVAKPPPPQRKPPPPPPSVSASSTIPSSPKSLPPPRNQFILPYDSVAEMPGIPTTSTQARPHAGAASIETPNQQTSVVDAIAQTMVGEWMWKYVRKRTSFGITENPQAEFEMGRNGENGNSSGVRHKRWVWLAPYENAVIWSSKQPTSGSALLGKGGRKLMIQSVLDVKDDTPLPKNAGSQSAFDRSILILTPQRALKFTAVSRERHYIWLTALSFLSHSTRGMDDLASPPPVPPQEYQSIASTQEPQSTFRRTPVRDSIRVAKARSRPSMGAHSFSSPIGGIEQKIIQDTIMTWGDREAESEDAAEPPQVPRMAAHARKRSNTGPRPVPLSAFHNYPTTSSGIASSYSLQAPTSRDKYDRFAPRSRGASGSGPSIAPVVMTRRVTDTTRDSYVPPPPVVPDNFFDPVGTLRMEAFVFNKHENHIAETTKAEPVKKPKMESRSYRTRQGRKKDLSYWGMDESAGGSGRVGNPQVQDEDPFTGF